MKTIWNDRQGNRDCKAHCLLVTIDGDVYAFVGEAIAGVCASACVAHKKAGKWSNSTWEVTHADSTTVIQFLDDWEVGYAYPQVSWEEGFFWLAEKAPLLDRGWFERFIRANHPTTAERWDAAKVASDEFGGTMNAEQVAMVRAATSRIAAEKAAHEAAEEELRRNSPFSALRGLHKAV